MGIGGNIKQLRKLNNMDQKTLADLLHVSNRTISSWECDRTEPNMGMISQMSKIFHCTKTDLIGPDYGPDFIYTSDDVSFTIERQSDHTDDQVIRAYRVAPEDIKKAINKLLDLEG